VITVFFVAGKHTIELHCYQPDIHLSYLCPQSDFAKLLKFYPKLTFAVCCLTVRGEPTREEIHEVLAKGGQTHAKTAD
jgi:hypothetical protein